MTYQHTPHIYLVVVDTFNSFLLVKLYRGIMLDADVCSCGVLYRVVVTVHALPLWPVASTMMQIV